jgi:hypothetical protein
MWRRVPPTRSLLGRAVAATAVLAAVAVPAAGASAVSAPSAALFASPDAIAAVGPWVVVADHASASLTILAASNGALVGRVGHSGLAVGAPTSLLATIASGHRVVLVAGARGAVAELALVPRGPSVTVTRVRVLRPIGCGGGAAHLAAYGARGLVEACADGVVSVWRLATGTLVRTIATATTGVTDATGITVLGSTAVVTNAAGSGGWGSAADGVTQLSLLTGARLRTVTNAQDAAYKFSAPSGIASDGTNLWEINASGNTVDELSGATLRFMASSSTNVSDPAVVAASPTTVWVSSSSSSWSSSMVTQFQVVNGALQSQWMMCNSNGPYQFADPSGFALAGSTLWVANATNDLVDEMNASSGALVATYH